MLAFKDMTSGSLPRVWELSCMVVDNVNLTVFLLLIQAVYFTRSSAAGRGCFWGK